MSKSEHFQVFGVVSAYKIYVAKKPEGSNRQGILILVLWGFYMFYLGFLWANENNSLRF